MKRVFGALTAAAFALVVQPASAHYFELTGLNEALQQKADEQAKKTQPLDKGQAAEQLTEKQKEIKELSDQATVVQSKMSAILASGDPTQSKEALDALRKMVDELTGINKRLGELATDIEEIKGLLKKQNDSVPAMEKDIANLKRFTVSSWAQFQYRDANNVDSTGSFAGQHGFQMRRARMALMYQADPKASIRISFDAATGNDNKTFELKDAMLNYQIAPNGKVFGTLLNAGQMNMPLGYEITRSSADREFPERMTYSRRLMNNERTRGAMITHGLSPNTVVYGGLFTPLTIGDPEQVGKTAVNKVAPLLGVRYTDKNSEYSLSYLFGKRPMVGNDPTKSVEADRKFLYATAVYNGLLVPQLSIRGEYMTGHDRVPSATPSLDDGNNMNGYQVQLTYSLNKSNKLFTRYGVSDFNTATNGNAVREYGVGYRYYMSNGAWVTLTWEQFDDPALFTNRYNVTTLRYTIRF